MDTEHKQELDKTMMELVKVLSAFLLSLRTHSKWDRFWDKEIARTEALYEERIRQLDLILTLILNSAKLKDKEGKEVELPKGNIEQDLRNPAGFISREEAKEVAKDLRGIAANLGKPNDILPPPGVITSKILEHIEDGLYEKYIVSKADGTPVDSTAEYFVLRLDENCKDKNHLFACRVAILVYADRIREVLPELAADIEKKYNLSVQ